MTPLPGLSGRDYLSRRRMSIGRPRGTPYFRSLAGALCSLALSGCLPGRHSAPRKAEIVQIREAGQTTEVQLTVCVIMDGRIARVPAAVVGTDTVVGGERFRSRYLATTPPYALNAPWYSEHRPIRIGRYLFTPYGLPRTLSADSLRAFGDFQGVPLFALNRAGEVDVVFVPVRPGCEFHGYQAY
jgi:hypothetical protein